MDLELVHHIQKSYRSILEAISKPGKVTKISNCNVKETIALMFLDREVTFKISDENLLKRFKELTGAIETNYNFDYLFLLLGTDYSKELMRRSTIGTLTNPHKSTTVIKEFDSDSLFTEVILDGPGIKGTMELNIPLTKEEIEIRAGKNKEYPLGIDIIFFSEKGEIIALPRTSNLKVKENIEWGM